MVLAAAFTVMEKTRRLLVEAEREVKDFWAGERGEHIGVEGASHVCTNDT